ncbi:MAG: FKBP-type peptidyl-prolyl cis-trans isomerase [Candidatus Heimdallarchaeota archaeon]|nr:MAG: FKBP-type peptidyl-prolyl cis-trans isomerase [Candidatus Heimdallarchaeota archaeon]
MPISENDWIKIDYTGRLKENSKVFDTTMEDIARSENIFDEKRSYSPLLCRAGDEKFLIPGLAKNLVGLELNSPQTIEIATEDAYGERDTKKIEMVPTKRLRKANLDPRVGNHVQLAGRSGTILWVGGGRTRIDFNHPLAGKDLVFDVTIVEHLENEEEIRKEIISRRFPGINLEDVPIEVSEDPATISISLPNYLMFMEGLAIAKYSLATELRDFLDFRVVKFIDLFDYQEKTPTEEDSEAKEEEEEEREEEEDSTEPEES